MLYGAEYKFEPPNNSHQLGLQELGGQAGQSTQTSTVPAAGHATKLALDKKFRDSHSRAVDCVLLPATAGTTMLIEELGRLAHGHANQLCLRTAATTTASTTRCEFFERLEGRSAAQGRCMQTTTGTPLIDVAMRILDGFLVNRFFMLAFILVDE